MEKIFYYVILFVCLFCRCAPPPLQIDADFPGGNINVVSIKGDTVQLEQDLRDTEGNWFYWSFRIRGAAGRTLHFEFMNGNVISSRGPAISTDGCSSWRWQSELGFTGNCFSYIFKPYDHEVYFSTGMNYTEKDLRLFLNRFKNHPDLTVKTLCKTRKGREVELLQIGKATREPDFKVALFSRHHSCEMMATRVLEGLMEEVLSDSEEGRRLRAYADFFIVPFVDKDGVEDGDQGKNRRPYDHNRDYIQRMYPEIRAITAQVSEWLDGKPLFLLDLHCPMLRDGGDECFHFSGANPNLPDFQKIVEKKHQFGSLMKNLKTGALPVEVTYSQRNFNTASKDHLLKLQMCQDWGESLPNVIFSSTLETPYANASGLPVDTKTAREFGHDLARTICVYLDNYELIIQ